MGAKKLERIYGDIGSSGFFQLVGWNPINIDEMNLDWEDDSSSGVSDEDYDPLEHSNPYTLKEFNVLDSVKSHDFKEYVITCPPLKDFFISDRSEIFYHVSKEYNVSPVEGQYKPGRFVFANFIPEVQTSYNYMILAEEPARAYRSPRFNVELHYIQMRKYISPGKMMIIFFIMEKRK